ncbi:sensor histidine kinase [Actinoplanes sp. NEAU-A12]|uniref:histidine kinase n=1 Tax=Actinoplanes sandaracinus TaxID=3045177 RepID=A0ABT6WNM2_9ACTN|nr:sensor histidine kinase [Actinoplanes sandaracinus]MDI6101323.1 sensor histidine kinase [Actinoplanes sandaracinus]
MTRNFTAAAAALTLLGVPAGLALTRGDTRVVMTGTLAVALAGLVLLTRRWPLAVLLFTILTLTAWRISHLIEAGWLWPATAALVALVMEGRLWTAVSAAAVTLAWGLNWDIFVDPHGPDWVLTRVGGEALWVAAALAAATAYRNTLRWRTEVAHRLAHDERQRELEAGRRRAEERVEIARDLHDVVSHTLAVVGVHLNVALDAFDTEPDEAKASLKLAQEVRGRAMTDLKALVGVLREGALPTLTGLDRLLGQVREAGLAVSFNEVGDPVEVPAPVAAAVHRVVQESLTNTVRHAGGATRVVVTLRYGPSDVLVDVRDDGPAGSSPAPVTEGHGISGMRERVAALGGTLTAGPGPNGFTVRARIPVTERP